MDAQANPALIACPDCAGKVSIRAATCPHCGLPLNFERMGRDALEAATGGPLKKLGGEETKANELVVELSFRKTQISDADLEHLKRLPHLESLNIECPQITDRGLSYLQGLTRLVLLGLDTTQVTDIGLPYLEKLTNLSVLLLADTKITDAGLEYLKMLENLEMLSLEGTQVTDAGVADLQKALPDCEIIP